MNELDRINQDCQKRLDEIYEQSIKRIDETHARNIARINKTAKQAFITIAVLFVVLITIALVWWSNQ